MFAILHALGMFVADLFKSWSRLEAENLLLRHQLTIAMRQAPPRLRLRGTDRALLIETRDDANGGLDTAALASLMRDVFDV